MTKSILLKTMLYAGPILGVTILGIFGMSAICFFSDIDTPGGCISHSHEVLLNIISERIKSAEFLISFVSTSVDSNPSPSPDDDNCNSETNSSSNTDLVVFSSMSEFQKQLSSESKLEIKRFLQRSCTGCGSDEEWNPIKGNCLNYPNLASYDTGARVISAKTLKPCKQNIPDGINPQTIGPISGLNIAIAPQKAESVLMEAVLPGRSWAFQGHGELDIKLTLPAVIIGLTVHHPPKSILIPGYFSSAPKRLNFYGLKSETDNHPFLFGQYEYSADGLSAQTFVVERWVSTPYPLVRLEIISNHGNPVFTTLYRVEVHGIVVGDPWFMKEAKLLPDNVKTLLGSKPNDPVPNLARNKPCFL